MTETRFKPIVYLKQSCPFCMKIRLFLLEAGMAQDVETRDFAPGTAEEEAIRAELAPHFETVSFPAAQLEPGRYVAESDDIVSFLAAKFGRDPANMPVYQNYVDGPFALAMRLGKENLELRKAASAPPDPPTPPVSQEHPMIDTAKWARTGVSSGVSVATQTRTDSASTRAPRATPRNEPETQCPAPLRG